MDDRDEEPVVIYHSHTATEAYPSRTDISYANEPSAHYVLVSTREPKAPRVPLVTASLTARSPRSRSSVHGMIRCPGRLQTTALGSPWGPRPPGVRY